MEEARMNTLLSENLSKSKRNDAAGIARVISMFMIIGCHLFSWLGINSLAMIMNVSVYTFLIISGMLYSTKRITQPCACIKKRWVKLWYLCIFLSYFYLFTAFLVQITVPYDPSQHILWIFRGLVLLYLDWILRKWMDWGTCGFWPPLCCAISF